MSDRDRCAVNWLVETEEANPLVGRVRWDPAHSLWNGGMLVTALIAGSMLATPGAILLFVITTGAGLLLGHSVGFHRLMIHRSFRTVRWVEYALIWCGTAVGMSGPFWMIRSHDVRDWAQRQADCHDYLAHRRSPLVDAWWQLHCRLDLARPPAYDLSSLERDRVYHYLDRWWMAQQAPIALLFWAIGGWGWVVWGVCARVAISVHGHWLVGHLAHRHGPQSWLVEHAGVQAHDVPWAAIPTMGEAWHNNHHAYPGSARIGLYPGQSDFGFVFIRLLERFGLAWDVCTPAALPDRERSLRLTQRGLQRRSESL